MVCNFLSVQPEVLFEVNKFIHNLVGCLWMEIQWSLYASFSPVCIKIVAKIDCCSFMLWPVFLGPLFCVILWCWWNGHMPDIKSFFLARASQSKAHWKLKQSVEPNKISDSWETYSWLDQFHWSYWKCSTSYKWGELTSGSYHYQFFFL